MSQIPANLESSVVERPVKFMRLAPARPSFAVPGTHHPTAAALRPSTDDQRAATAAGWAAASLSVWDVDTTTVQHAWRTLPGDDGRFVFDAVLADVAQASVEAGIQRVYLCATPLPEGPGHCDLFGLDGDHRPQGLSKLRFKAIRDRVALCFVARLTPTTRSRAWTKEAIDALDH